MGIRQWLTQPLPSAESRALEAEMKADADQARRGLAALDRRMASDPNPDLDYYTQERDRLSDNLDYALGRGHYK